MIKSKEGKTKIKGTTRDLMADLTCVVKCVREGLCRHMSAEKVEELMNRAISLGMVKDEDVLFGTLEEISKVLSVALEELKAKGVTVDEEDYCDCCECNVDCTEAGCDERRAEVVAPYEEEQA